MHAYAQCKAAAPPSTLDTLPAANQTHTRCSGGGCGSWARGAEYTLSAYAFSVNLSPSTHARIGVAWRGVASSATDTFISAYALVHTLARRAGGRHVAAALPLGH